MSGEDVSRVVREHLFGTWRRQRGWEPLNVVRADGVYFYDSQGRKYLDFSSQLVNVNLGYGNESVINAIKRQLETLQYISPAFATEARARAARALLEIMPEGLTKFFFSTSGTEANEAAVKIARLYKKPAYKIIVRYRSYHGSTLASISMTGDYRRWFVEPHTMHGVVRVPEPYCYRCPLGLKYPECGLACVNYVDYVIKNEKNVAAILVEPITGTNGVVVPPKEYLPTLKKVAEENDVLFIADEVMTGWGRVGDWWAVNLWGVKPDVLTTAKGASASYVPIGITAVSKKIADYFEDEFFAHGHTFEAHPVSLAAIPAVIEEYRRLDLLSHVRAMGEYLAKRLEELKERHRSIGDVRVLAYSGQLNLLRTAGRPPLVHTTISIGAWLRQLIGLLLSCLAWVFTCLMVHPGS
ncbi:aminotransferase class III-fold pyridoxal phosphate-dependent enzyme [Vulcanisaeta sp. JCM 16161]|uniref:aminotransferase family protein n=1 Tax=Vulcanisaeta sp. JCM 16161 TaxID=1295372 RepID=UPI000AEEBCF3|nr:aminotransferase class III-fold pyridoxal phosphate-dependent enzyme [Vulcanisaeta sp. JCM 16161]